MKLDISFIEEVAREAGDFALEHLGKVKRETKDVPIVGDVDKDFLQEAKDCFSFVDINTQKIIMQRLIAAYPNLGIVAEESDQDMDFSEFSHRNKITNHTLVVDPIDGTTNYLSATPGDKNHGKKNGNYWGVSIAILNNTNIVAGVMHFPILNKTITTEKGSGTYLNNNKVQFIDCKFSPEDFIRISSTFSSEGRRMKDFLKPNPNDPGCIVMRILGMMYANSGKASEIPAYNAYLSKGAEAVDLGCSPLIIEEAGGFVGGFDSQRLNPYNSWKYDKQRKTLVTTEPFAMVPNKQYLDDMLRFIVSKGIDLERV